MNDVVGIVILFHEFDTMNTVVRFALGFVNGRQGIILF